jgi:hypothetical protein
VAVYFYAGEGWRNYALCAVGLIVLIYVPIESVNLARLIKSRANKNENNRGSEVSALALLDENEAEIKSWDLRGRTGLVIGRGGEDEPADIDLSDTEYFPLISAEHATLNYAAGDWRLADVGSKNGTALTCGGSGQKLLLAPGEPVPIRPGDRIYIAEETILAVR